MSTSNILNVKKKKIILLAIVILIFIFFAGYFTYKHINDKPKEIIAGSYLPKEKDATKISEKERKKIAQKKIDESKFTLTIYPEATFENGESRGTLYIRNETSNIYPITVQLVEDKSGDIIYDSGAIQPGYEITEGKLVKNLTKGIYKCTANVSLFDPKTEKYRGQTAAEVDLEIEN